MPPTISKEKFREILPKICDRETSADPSGWTPENPLWAHCAGISALAHTIFGGKIMCASLVGIRGFEHMKNHYWNELPDGSVEDFTAVQFQGEKPSFPKTKNITGSVIYLRLKKSKRYKLLTFRLAKALNSGNPIFADPIYRECFYAALGSPCQKM